MSEDLPKQELLIKLLKMTTSSNDGEAVIAVRKANDLLKSAGWDWEKLIHGKIKVIEDPFKSVDVPYNNSRARPVPPAPRRTPAPPPHAPAPPPPHRPAPPPPPPPQRQPVINSNKANIYAGWCFCCGDAVLQNQGFIFDPSAHNNRARSKWQIACKGCNASVYANVGSAAAPRQRPLGNVAPSLNDI